MKHDWCAWLILAGASALPAADVPSYTIQAVAGSSFSVDVFGRGREPLCGSTRKGRFVTIFRKDGETSLAKELHQQLVILNAVNHHLASQPTAFAEPQMTIERPCDDI